MGLSRWRLRVGVVGGNEGAKLGAGRINRNLPGDRRNAGLGEADSGGRWGCRT